MTSLWIALQITLVGMGLVFAAILLLWAVMALLVKFTSDEPSSEVDALPAPESFVNERELKQRAASAAVVFALATRKKKKTDEGIHEFPLLNPENVSAWQSVMRTNMLNKRGRVR